MRALVTGADGFVGQHLMAHLHACGDDVVGSDRRAGGPDLLDGPALSALVHTVSPDVVYHLAGASDVAGSWQDPVDTFRANAEGTLRLLRACAEAGVGRILAVSSADVYGRVTEAELPLSEEAPLRPVSPYAASKAAADFVALQAYLGYGLDVLRVRAFNHLGPGQTTRFVAPALAERIVRCEHSGNDEVPVGNLEARRDVTDVRDVVRAYRMLIEHGTPGDAYNVCSGRDLAVQELADHMVALAHVPVRLVPDPSLIRPVDVPVLRGDNSKICRDTGWMPEIPIERTLVDVLDDARSRLRVV
jgi:GDP-4-dehydro-6-deoxy-D-mannose reductase